MVPVEIEHEAASEKKRRKKIGRPSKTNAPAFLAVESALATYHKYETGGSVGRDEPASLAKLAELSGKTKPTVSRYFVAKLGKPGYKRYQQACAKKAIGGLLAKWQNDLSSLTPEFIDALQEECDRRRQDD